MPKQLINLVGVLLVVAVLALGIFLVAMPLATQALGLYGQSQQVAQTNTLYKAQVDALTRAKANKENTDAAVAALRAQIPATPQLDQVFELIAQASVSSGATIKSATAGTAAAFSPRGAAISAGGQATAPAPAPSPSPSAGGIVGQAQQDRDQANAQTTQTNAGTGSTDTGAATGSSPQQTRTQIDFAINVTATDMGQVTAFLDALRAGPRLLSNVTSTVAPGGSGIDVSVSALTYVDGAPVTTTGTK